MVAMMTEQEVMDGFNKIVKCVQIKLRDNRPDIFILGDEILANNSIDFNDYVDTLKFLWEHIEQNLLELVGATKRQSQRIAAGSINKNSALAFSKKMLYQCNKNMLPMLFVCTETNKSTISEIETYELSEKHPNIIYVVFKSEDVMNILASKINFAFQMHKRHIMCNKKLANDILTDIEEYIKQELSSLFEQIYIYFGNEKYDTAEISICDILEEILDLQFPYRLDNVIDNDFAYKGLKCFEFAKYATGELEVSTKLSNWNLENIIADNLQCKKLYNLISFKLYQLHTESFYWNIHDFIQTLFLPPYNMMLRNFDCYVIAKSISDFYKQWHYCFTDKIATPIQENKIASMSIYLTTIEADRPSRPKRNGFFCYKNSSEMTQTLSLLSQIFDIPEIQHIQSACMDIPKKWREYKYPFRFLEDYFMASGKAKEAEVTKTIVEMCCTPYADIEFEKVNSLMNLMVSDFDWESYKSKITNDNLLTGICLYIGCEKQDFIDKSDIYDWKHEAIKTLWNKKYFKEVYDGTVR